MNKWGFVEPGGLDMNTIKSDDASRDGYPMWVCIDCGTRYGHGLPVGHPFTVHDGTCELCGASASVTEPRDFGYLKRGWRQQYAKDLRARVGNPAKR